MSPARTGGEPEALRGAMKRAASRLADWQNREGMWPNLYEGGPYLEALYALGMRMLRRGEVGNGQDGAWVRRLLGGQNEDGGIPLWRGGPSDTAAGIESYLALRLAGVEAGDPALQKLGRWIAKHGGLDRCPASTWMKLVWTGAVPDGRLEGMPPESFCFLDYRRLPALVRQQKVCDAALAIALYLRGPAEPQPAAGVPAVQRELAPPVKTKKIGSDLCDRGSGMIRRWARLAPRALRDPIVFRAYDAMVAEAQRWPTLPVALHAALAVEAAGGRGSQAPALLDRTLSMLGASGGEHPPRPCDSSVRDAALAVRALAAADPSVRLQTAVPALLARYRSGRAVSSGGLAAGWPAGDLQGAPDAETTALVLPALRRCGSSFNAEHPVIREAAAALAAAQQGDGGWIAWPGSESAAHVTATVLEALIESGHPRTSPAVVRAVRYFEQTQHAEGWWEGAHQTGLLPATAQVLRGLRAASVDTRGAAVLRAGEWIRSIQNADGGWGEAPSAGASRHFTPGPSTPAQTAWALLGLLAGGDNSSESVLRGFAWLLERQREDGLWDPVAPCRPGVAGAPFLLDPLGAVAWPVLALHERLVSLSPP